MSVQWIKLRLESAVGKGSDSPKLLRHKDPKPYDPSQKMVCSNVLKEEPADAFEAELDTCST